MSSDAVNASYFYCYNGIIESTYEWYELKEEAGTDQSEPEWDRVKAVMMQWVVTYRSVDV